MIVDGREIGFKLYKMIERNPNGQKVNRVNEFEDDKARFTWLKPYNAITSNGYNATIAKFVAIVPERPTSGSSNPIAYVNVNVTTYVYAKDVTVQFGSKTISVPKNTIKFTVDIANWKFANPANTLTFGVKIKIQRKDGQECKEIKIKSKDDSKDDDHNKEKRIFFSDSGHGAIDFPSFAIIDGVETPINATLRSPDSGDDKINGIYWSFPSFQKTLLYDPVLDPYTQTGSASFVSASTVSFVIMSIIVAILSILAF